MMLIHNDNDKLDNNDFKIYQMLLLKSKNYRVFNFDPFFKNKYFSKF